jgi:hypothetical protein
MHKRCPSIDPVGDGNSFVLLSLKVFAAGANYPVLNFKPQICNSSHDIAINDFAFSSRLCGFVSIRVQCTSVVEVFGCGFAALCSSEIRKLAPGFFSFTSHPTNKWFLSIRMRDCEEV